MTEGESLKDQKISSGPVERALDKFSKLDNLPLVSKEAVARLIDSYRRFAYRQGQELTAEEVRDFLREKVPQGIEKLLSLVAQEIAQGAADAEVKTKTETEAETVGQTPPTATPSG